MMFGNGYNSYGGNNGYYGNGYNSYGGNGVLGYNHVGGGMGYNSYNTPMMNNRYGPYESGYRSGGGGAGMYGAGLYDDYMGIDNQNYISTPFTERGIRSSSRRFGGGGRGWEIPSYGRGDYGMGGMYGGGGGGGGGLYGVSNHNNYYGSGGGGIGRFSNYYDNAYNVRSGGLGAGMYGDYYGGGGGGIGGRVLRPDVGGNTYNNSDRSRYGRRYDSDWDARWGTSQSTHAHTVMGPGAGRRFHTDQWNGISSNRYYGNDYGNRVFAADVTGPRTYRQDYGYNSAYRGDLGGMSPYYDRTPYHRGSTAYQRRAGAGMYAGGGW